MSERPGAPQVRARGLAPEADKRRHKFIPDASRLAIEEIRLEIERRLFRRHGKTFHIAWGRVDHALHALLGLVAYPTDPEDVEVFELALDVVRVHDADAADYHARRWREHVLQRLQGGPTHAG